MMFSVSRIVGIPHLIRRQVFAQVINVPMASPGNFAVMSDPGFYASRTEGTAHVGIVPSFEIKTAQLSDLKFRILLQLQDLLVSRHLLVVLDRVRTELLLSGVQTVRRYPQTPGNLGHRITELHHLLDGLDLELFWISFATHYSPL